uniref:Polyprotein allergen nematode domain-containing protein n=1 Tax=Angiostrongylus cantonensis TaxID=6313 RepID=A0A0K0DRF2_ANGCA
MDSYKTRLADEYRSRVDAWTEACTKLLKEDLSRKRREIDKNFNDFIQWMTEEQKQSVIDMKAAGNSFDEIRDKGNEFFGALATNRQVSLKEDFKEKCKAYFEKISNPDEVERMKSLYNSGKEAEIRSIVKNVVARLTGDDKQLAIKMEKLCTDVFDVKVRVHKDIDSKINKRLSWMTNEQKEEVKKMYADGKPQAEIRARIFEFLSAIEGPAGLAAKEQTRKECYKWMEEVASAEEIAALHKMHETDHDACKKKVREFIGRLPAEKKEEVEKNLPFCEKVWYGEHTHHSAHGHRHLAARHRRHLHAIDKFLDWLKPEQKRELEEIENSGAHFDNVIAQVKKFYDMLPEEKKAELKANFKNLQSQCFDWVKEVATPEELENILKMHQQKDHEELKKKLTELESRLTEEQKHTVEHVREVCLGVWELQVGNSFSKLFKKIPFNLSYYF